MRINFYSKSLTKKQKKELTEAANFFGKILLHPRTLKTINIDFEDNPEMENQAECLNEDGTKRSRNFTITFRNKPDDDPIIENLAHEMVHVKQYVKNELTDMIRVSKDGFSIDPLWHGTVWKPGPREDAYFDSPWEVEAYGKTAGLIWRWEHRND